MTSHHLYHILLLWGNAQVSSTLKEGRGGGFKARGDYQDAKIPGDYLRAYVQWAFVCQRSLNHQEALRLHCGVSWADSQKWSQTYQTLKYSQNTYWVQDDKWVDKDSWRPRSQKLCNLRIKGSGPQVSLHVESRDNNELPQFFLRAGYCSEQMRSLLTAFEGYKRIYWYKILWYCY